MPKIKSITVFAGSDDAAVSRSAREFAAAHTPPDAGEFGVDTIDGSADNADDAARAVHQTVQSLLTMPFFGGGKLVWLKNASFLGDTVTGRSAAVQEALEKLTETIKAGLPEGILFLLSAGPIDKRRAFFKTLDKVADVTVTDRIDASKAGWEEQAAEVAEQALQQRGYQIEPKALQGLIARCGPETRQIESEVEKLALYVGAERGTVTAEDVRIMVPLTRAGVIWELGNAIAERQLRAALALLDRLLKQGESPVGILLVAIIPTVRNLLVVRDLMKRHRLQPPEKPFFFANTLKRLPEEAVRHLPRKKDGGVNTYALGIAATTANRFEVGELVDALEACLLANTTLVSSGLEASIVLGSLLTRILQPANTAANAGRS